MTVSKNLKTQNQNYFLNENINMEDDEQHFLFRRERQVQTQENSLKNTNQLKTMHTTMTPKFIVLVFILIFGIILSYALFSNEGGNDNPSQVGKQKPQKGQKDREKQHKQILIEKPVLSDSQMQIESQNQDQPGQSFQIQLQQKPIDPTPTNIQQQNFQDQLEPHNQQQQNQQQQDPWKQTYPNSKVKDKYFLKVPLQQFLELSHPDKFFGSSLSKTMSGMSLNQLQHSLSLLYVTHNVNFKGQVTVQLAPYQSNSVQQKQKKIKQLLEVEQQVYDHKYSILQYMQNQLPFCIVTPSYNNVQSKLYLRNLDSLFMQNYQNYHIVYIDDASTDGTQEAVAKYLKDRKIPSQKLKFIRNQKNLKALNNIYLAITQHCKKGEIVALVDGDDALIGRQVLALYNAIYQKTQSALVYSNYLHVMFNQKAIIGASSRPIPPDLIARPGGIRNERGFFTSHLLTFYVDLFLHIKKQDLTYENGTFFYYAYDVAMCTPMLEMIGDRFMYIPELTYEYRYDTGQNDPGEEQMLVTSIVFDKKPYEKLKGMPWIDGRENYLKQVQAQEEDK